MAATMTSSYKDRTGNGLKQDQNLKSRSPPQEAPMDIDP